VILREKWNGTKSEGNGNRLSPIRTGELSRIEFCLQPGRSTARLFEISPRIMQRPTTPQTHFQHLLSDGDD